MKPQSLDTITDELRQQRAAINEDVSALETELASRKDQLARIDSAVLTLSGNGPPENANGRSQKHARKAPLLPAAKKADVIAAMRRVLEEEGPLKEDALKIRVEAELKKNDFSRLGFAMRWKEVIQDPQFLATPAGLRFATVTTSGTPNQHDSTSRNSNNATQSETLEA